MAPLNAVEFVGCIIAGFVLRVLLVKADSVMAAAMWGGLFGAGTVAVYASAKWLILRGR